jgi:hypothetical protein
LLFDMLLGTPTDAGIGSSPMLVVCPSAVRLLKTLVPFGSDMYESLQASSAFLA